MQENTCIQENFIKFAKESFAGQICQFFIPSVPWLSICSVKHMYRHTYVRKYMYSRELDKI